jgi:hypothetical protein
MPTPFTLPKQVPLSTNGGLLSNAKLYFYLTTTTTPQNVYQDYGLTTPHTNPVVADGNGVFPLIFLGRTNRYSVKLATSADVEVYTVDDIGPDGATALGAASIASSNTFTGAYQKIQNAEPRLIIDETDAGTDKRLWDFDVQAGILKLRTRTDADGSGVTIATITRGSATSVSSIQLGAIPFSGYGVSTTVVRTSTGSSSITTLANDSQLVATIDASHATNYNYELFAHIFGGAGGISYNINYSGTATSSGVSNISGHAVYNGTGAFLVMKGIEVAVTTSTYSTATLSATNPQDYIYLRGKLKALGNGTLAFSYGLNSASGTVSVGQGSWLKVTPIG